MTARVCRDTINAIITITDQSEGPVIAGTTSFTFAENYDIIQPLATYTATDAKDGRRVYPQWSLSGRDGGDFLIDRLSGVNSSSEIFAGLRPASGRRPGQRLRTHHPGTRQPGIRLPQRGRHRHQHQRGGSGDHRHRTSRTVQENTTATIYTYRATDPDLNDTFAWSTGGDDGSTLRHHQRRQRRPRSAGLRQPARLRESPADLDRRQRLQPGGGRNRRRRSARRPGRHRHSNRAERGACGVRRRRLHRQREPGAGSITRAGTAPSYTATDPGGNSAASPPPSPGA